MLASLVLVACAKFGPQVSRRWADNAAKVTRTGSHSKGDRSRPRNLATLGGGLPNTAAIARHKIDNIGHSAVSHIYFEG